MGLPSFQRGLGSLDEIKMCRVMSISCLPAYIHVVVCHVFKAL